MRRGWLVFCLIAVVTGTQAEKKYREFKDTQGRSIKGRIQAYDEADGEVRFERDNGIMARVPITVFSDEDQAYIREWLIASYFEKESSFKIEIERHRERNEEESDRLSKPPQTVKVEDTYYEIILSNRSSTSISNLVVEYCIFYEQEVSGGEEEEGIYYAKIPVECVEPREEMVLKTDRVSTYVKNLDAGYYYVAGQDNRQDGQVHGIWTHVRLDPEKGPKMIRQAALPDSLPNSRSWSTQSKRAGINK